eukprot:TRINITY_DN39638_c0_g1_i1.p1 TRINITY_DN39638_c0_g1~~TRINITY_DN39638_c0_g1_i1.p1  ORF type:complete len:1183 (+),score=310.16 TRINITY_DN39638_c0_g1_i1:212-3760(+)
MLRAKQFLLENAVRTYVRNVEHVLEKLSVSSVMFGSVRIDEVDLVPEMMQDTLFNYIFYGSEIVKITAYDVTVSVQWTAVSSKSIKIHAKSADLDLVVHDPSKREAVPQFWAAQKTRLLASKEAVATPAESGMSYKILGGLVIGADVILARLRSAEDVSPRLLVTLKGFHYGPATQVGEKTEDLDDAIRPNPALSEVNYSYTVEMKGIGFALLPRPDEAWAEKTSHVVVEAKGFVLGTHGRVASVGKRETPFYSTGLVYATLEEINAPDDAAVPLEGLAGIVDFMTKAAATNSAAAADSPDDAEGTSEDAAIDSHTASQAGGGDAAEVAEEESRRQEDDQLDPQRATMQRALERKQTNKDMADLIKGCSRSSRATSHVEASLQEQPDTSERCSSLASGQQTTNGSSKINKDGAVSASSRARTGSGESSFTSPCEVRTISSRLRGRPTRSRRASAEATSEWGDCLSSEEGSDKDDVDDKWGDCSDVEDFMDCEEFEEAEEEYSRQGLGLGDGASGQELLRQRLEQGALKRTAFTFEKVNLAVRGPAGALRLQLRTLAFSIDGRSSWTGDQKTCLRDLFAACAAEGKATDQIPLKALVSPSSQKVGSIAESLEAASDIASSTAASAGPSATVDEPTTKDEGTTYAAVTLEGATLSFAAPQQASKAVFQLHGGLQLRHRGAGDATSARELLGAGAAPAGDGTPLQLLEVLVADIDVCDHYREDAVAMLQSLSAAFSPPAEETTAVEATAEHNGEAPASTTDVAKAEHAETASDGCCCVKVEAMNVRLEAPLNGQVYRCALPSLRVQSSLSSVSDLWNLALWDYRHLGLPDDSAGGKTSLLRGMAEPMWANDPAARSYLDGYTSVGQGYATTPGSPADGTPQNRLADLALERPLALREQEQRMEEEQRLRSRFRLLNGTSASELIAGLQKEVEQEARARDQEKARAEELEKKLLQVFGALHELPENAGIQQLLLAGGEGLPADFAKSLRGLGLVGSKSAGGNSSAEDGRSDAGSRAGVGDPATGGGLSFGESFGPEGPDEGPKPYAVESPALFKVKPHEQQDIDGEVAVTTLMFDMEPGEKISHTIEGLMLGESVEWAVEELRALTVDVTVILRSRSKLHNARRLRQTERTPERGSPFRDSFIVPQDFGEAALPLSMDIQLSNEFSWWAEKRVRLTLWRHCPVLRV